MPSRERTRCPAAKVGQDKDSEKRQRSAVERYAKRNGCVIAASFYDAAISGADPVDARPGFADMLRMIAGNGAKGTDTGTLARSGSAAMMANDNDLICSPPIPA
jgi:hypothetical protein